MEEEQKGRDGEATGNPPDKLNKYVGLFGLSVAVHSFEPPSPLI